jgi:hypothetical protein
MAGMTNVVLSLTRCPAAFERETATWLGHVATAVHGRPEVHTARRLVAIDDPAHWIVLHDVDAADTEAVVNEIRSHEQEPDGQAIVGQTLRREHRVYRPIAVPEVANADDLDIAGEIVSCVWWTPREEAEAELNAWYDGEHIPLLMAVPGWLRIRRFELVSGCGPRYFAVHDIESDAALADPLRLKVRNTPWRAEVLKSREQYDAQMYRASPRN